MKKISSILLIGLLIIFSCQFDSPEIARAGNVCYVNSLLDDADGNGIYLDLNDLVQKSIAESIIDKLNISEQTKQDWQDSLTSYVNIPVAEILSTHHTVSVETVGENFTATACSITPEEFMLYNLQIGVFDNQTGEPLTDMAFSIGVNPSESICTTITAPLPDVTKATEILVLSYESVNIDGNPKVHIVRQVATVGPAPSPVVPLILYSDNDYGCAWNMEGSSLTAENSFKLGTNLAVYAANDKDSLKIGHIRHNGDWNPDANDMENLSKAINSRTGLDVTFQKGVEPGIADLADFQILYITGHSQFSMTDDQISALKAYLEEGGILFADDCSNTGNGGFQTSIINILTRSFGLPKLLSSEHPLYSSFYTLDGDNFSYSEAGNGTQWNSKPLYSFTVNNGE